MISVIIPVYNGEKIITKCLDSLSRQTKKPDEIIVVDDGSEDRTRDVVKKFKKIILLEQGHKGPASARNLGAKRAKGEILLFTDADCVPETRWVSEMTESFKSKGLVGVQGRYKTLQKGIIPRFIQLEIEDRYDRMKTFKTIDFIGSYAAGYIKKIFIDAKGFDESFPQASAEDPEFSFKLSKSGHKMIFNEKAIVFHNHIDSLIGYLKQKFWRAYWRVLLYRKHPNKIKSESYTPQILKLQILSLYFSLLFLAFSLLITPFIFVALSSFSLLILFTLPLSYKNFKSDRQVGLLTPFISIARTIVFSLGLIYGVMRL